MVTQDQAAVNRLAALPAGGGGLVVSDERGMLAECPAAGCGFRARAPIQPLTAIELVEYLGAAAAVHRELHGLSAEAWTWGGGRS
jgi:hypothetical protein